MKINRKAIVALIAQTLLSAAVHATDTAECIAPAKPGGGFDLTCNLIKDALTHPVLGAFSAAKVTYFPGGIGALAFDRAVSQNWSQPNTVVAFSTGSLVNLAQGKFGPHRPDAVRWLATIGMEYGILAVRKTSRIASLRALVADLKSNAASASFGAGGTVGSQDWIKAALLTRAAGSDHRGMRFISYEGGGQAITALLGGHVDVFCGDAGEARAALISGELRALAVLAPQRLTGALAGIPTAKEQGVDLVWPTVRGLYMGPGVTDANYDRWSKTMRRMLDSPEFARMARERGLEPYPMVGPSVAAYAQQEVDRMQTLARSLRLQMR